MIKPERYTHKKNVIFKEDLDALIRLYNALDGAPIYDSKGKKIGVFRADEESGVYAVIDPDFTV